MSEKRFEYSGAGWESKFRAGWGDNKKPEPRLLEFAEKYKSEIGPKILDIGSGVGRHSIPLAEMGYEVTGLEYTKAGVEITKQKEKEKGVKSDLVQGDFRDLPFADNSFDTVVSTATLHHNNWEGAETTFKEASRVLKSGGLFFFRVRSDKAAVEPDRKALDDKGISWSEINEDGSLELHHDFSLEELRELAEKCNFDFESEPFDEKKNEDGKITFGQWNVVFRKK